MQPAKTTLFNHTTQKLFKAFFAKHTHKCTIKSSKAVRASDHKHFPIFVLLTMTWMYKAKALPFSSAIEPLHPHYVHNFVFAVSGTNAWNPEGNRSLAELKCL